MSDWDFNYAQHHITDIACKIEELIATETDEKGRHYPPEIIARFRLAVFWLHKVAETAQRIDWLVGCDDDEETLGKVRKEADEKSAVSP